MWLHLCPHACSYLYTYICKFWIYVVAQFSTWYSCQYMHLWPISEAEWLDGSDLKMCDNNTDAKWRLGLSHSGSSKCLHTPRARGRSIRKPWSFLQGRCWMNCARLGDLSCWIFDWLRPCGFKPGLAGLLFLVCWFASAVSEIKFWRASPHRWVRT